MGGGGGGVEIIFKGPINQVAVFCTMSKRNLGGATC